ncbi:hypothetical protein HanRHA438_Chr12g0552641 [Helianthus annuus]|nr:hypothetical protein HanRHA438_Chr12g0552641 [Helianthus annuus]
MTHVKASMALMKIKWDHVSPFLNPQEQSNFIVLATHRPGQRLERMKHKT